MGWFTRLFMGKTIFSSIYEGSTYKEFLKESFAEKKRGVLLEDMKLVKDKLSAKKESELKGLKVVAATMESTAKALAILSALLAIFVWMLTTPLTPYLNKSINTGSTSNQMISSVVVERDDKKEKYTITPTNTPANQSSKTGDTSELGQRFYDLFAAFLVIISIFIIVLMYLAANGRATLLKEAVDLCLQEKNKEREEYPVLISMKSELEKMEKELSIASTYKVKFTKPSRFPLPEMEALDEELWKNIGKIHDSALLAELLQVKGVYKSFRTSVMKRQEEVETLLTETETKIQNLAQDASQDKRFSLETEREMLHWLKSEQEKAKELTWSNFVPKNSSDKMDQLMVLVDERIRKISHSLRE